MDNEFAPDFYSLTDEDGTTTNFELLDSFEENDIVYYALSPVDENGAPANDGEFVVLRGAIDEETAEEIMETIEDEEELDKVANVFIERSEMLFDEEETDEE
jgi:Protein of unknown function (DUF1292).